MQKMPETQKELLEKLIDECYRDLDSYTFPLSPNSKEEYNKVSKLLCDTQEEYISTYGHYYE